jgi:RecB family endonuclease NucS
MDMPREIVRIIVLHPDGPMTIHRAKRRRKQSKLLKPYAKLARTQARAQATHADTMLRLLSRSESKKKDGALKDSFKNTAKAARKSSKVWRKAYN